MMLKDYILLKYINKTASAEEVSQAENWIQASPENRKHFQEMLTVFYESNHLKDFKTFDVDSEWNQFLSEKVEFLEPIEDTLPFRKIILYASAACFALLSAFFFLSNPNADLISNSSGKQQLAVNLPDNTKVLLYPYSTLEYTSDYNEADQRKVTLTGKAKFDVVKNRTKPFIVETGLLSTKVLGTIFEINAKESTVQSVKVIEGKVMVINNLEKTDLRILKKGNAVQFSNDGFGQVTSTNPPKPVAPKKTKPAKKQVKKEVPLKPAIKKPIVKEEVKPIERKPEVKLSSYPVMDVLNFIDKKHADHALFSKSRKCKIGKENFIQLNLNESLEQIISRLESEYQIEYEKAKCDNCIRFKSISKK